MVKNLKRLEKAWFRSHNFQRLALTTGLLLRCDLSKLVNLRAARKPISDARTATYLILSCPPEKPQGRLIVERPFSVVAGPKLRVSSASKG